MIPTSILLRNITVIISWTLLCVSHASCDFNYGSIPFGKDMAVVLKSLSSATVQEDTNVTIGTYDALSTIFKDGIYRTSLEETASRLNPLFTRKFIIKESMTGELQEMQLFFGNNGTEHGVYSLFMVRKIYKPSPESSDAVFLKMKDLIMKKIPASPEITPTHYTYSAMKGYELNEMAEMAVWSRGSEKIILLVPSLLAGTGNPEILYISTEGLQNYLKSCKQFEKTRSQHTPPAIPASNRSDF